jgi:2-oxoglutarate ferredoxin oxidoreductase subunit gamma
MKEQVILAGFGGQGIMLAGMLMTYAGMLEGREVTWLPSYGPEMRGGTANCHVTLSDKPVSSPVIIKATSAIIMNKPSLDKFESCISPKGILLVNSSLIDKKTSRGDLNAHYIPANEIAAEVGNNKTANIVMLGAFVQATGVLEKQSCNKAMEDVLGKKNPMLLPLNMLAFVKGAEYISNNIIGY